MEYPIFHVTEIRISKVQAIDGKRETKGRANENRVYPGIKTRTK
jgi:hypothetical protein